MYQLVKSNPYFVVIDDVAGVDGYILGFKYRTKDAFMHGYISL